ncbi:OmpA family protein [Ferruginibacter sp. SUN106]|uniref:OmpA family protein n=1 Tax=Ferruginibacter sp. SUN106 TaxID=2978348 RepID=UPI003D3677CE
MNPSKYRRSLIIIFFFLFCCSTVEAQNLFANPGFEAINNCIEFKADCSPEAWFNIPAGNFLVNGRIAPRPVIGNMVLIVPVGSVLANFNHPRYVYTGLCCQLVAGEKYDLSFYLNTAKNNFKQLAFYFTEKEPMLATVKNLSATPSVIITKENVDGDYKDWKHVKCEYLATGNEKFFTITTAGLAEVEYSMGDAMNKSGDVLYFIDEIKLQAQGNAPVCAQYEANITKMFDYNYRHTNNVPVFKEEPVIAPVVKFTTDTIVIPDLLFDIGKYDLKPGLKNILDSLVTKLTIKKFLTIGITGHTDNSGNENKNQVLSENRAITIKNYLTEKIPGAAEKITAAGKGQYFPVAENATATGRQKNRRVEIVITYLNINK